MTEEHIKIIRNVHSDRDIEKALDKLPKDADVKQVLRATGLPSSFSVIYTLKKKPKFKMAKPVKPTVPKPELKKVVNDGQI